MISFFISPILTPLFFCSISIYHLIILLDLPPFLCSARLLSSLLLLSLNIGTNVCPNAAQSYYYDKSDYLTKYLDTSKATESEKAAMTALISHHRIHGTPYLCFGRGSGVFKLNEDNLVNSIYFDWKLTSICSPIIERNGL